MPTISRIFSALGLLLAGALAAPGALSGPTATTPIRIPTVEQIAQLPRMTGFELSPDGKHLIAVESRGDTRSILVWSTDNLSGKPHVIQSSAMGILSASFLKQDALAVTLWQPYDARLDGTLTKTFIHKLLITDLEGKTWKEPLESAAIAHTDEGKRLMALSRPSVLSRVPSDPDHIVVESDGLGRERDLFRYNIRTGVATRLMRLAEDDISVSVDDLGMPQAKARASNDTKGFFVALEIRNPDSGKWEEHFRSYVKDRDALGVIGMGARPNTIVLLSNVGQDRAGLYEYDYVERKITGTLFEHQYFEAVGIKRFRSRNPMQIGEYDGFIYGGPHGDDVYWLNPKFESVASGVAKHLGLSESLQTLSDVGTGKRAQTRLFTDASVAITDFQAGPDPIYLLRVSGRSYPTEHYLLRGQKLSLLAKEQPDIDRRALGTTRFVYYSARDGLNIPAILTTPDKELCGEGPYPAVIHPHGGPWARDDTDFDRSGWVTLLVSRCRVVLQPQYRGSAGWGRTLWKAGDAEWGQRMQDDKDDGVKWLVSEKLADLNRVAMFGFSYGGYAAFAAAVRPNGLYKCAIAGAGVSDLARIWASFYTNPFFRDRQEPTVRGLNPLTVADKIKLPIMVYHGDRDRTVPLEQSAMFVEQARKSAQPVDFHVLSDYGHGPAWKRDTIAKQLSLIDDYLATGCGGSGL